MIDFLVGLFLALVLVAIVQFLLLKKRNADIERAEFQAKIRELLDYLDGNGLNMVDDEGRNIIMIAASEKFYANRGQASFRDVISKAIKVGMDVNNVNAFNGWNALFYALEADHERETVDLLLSLGADPNYLDHKGRNALFKAMECEQIDMVTSVIEKIADLNYQKEDGETALMAAAKQMHVFAINQLLDKGVNAGLVNSNGQNAYEIALKNKKAHYKHSGDSAHPDAYGKHNHSIDEATRRIKCVIEGKKFRKRRYKSSSSSEAGNMEV